MPSLALDRVVLPDTMISTLHEYDSLSRSSVQGLHFLILLLAPLCCLPPRHLGRIIMTMMGVIAASFIEHLLEAGRCVL